MRVAKQWNRLPSEVIGPSILQDIQTQLDTVLSNLLLWTCFEQGDGLEDAQNIQPELVCDTMNRKFMNDIEEIQEQRGTECTAVKFIHNN